MRWTKIFLLHLLLIFGLIIFNFSLVVAETLQQQQERLRQEQLLLQQQRAQQQKEQQLRLQQQQRERQRLEQLRLQQEKQRQERLRQRMLQEQQRVQQQQKMQLERQKQEQLKLQQQREQQLKAQRQKEEQKKLQQREMQKKLMLEKARQQEEQKRRLQSERAQPTPPIKQPEAQQQRRTSPATAGQSQPTADPGWDKLGAKQKESLRRFGDALKSGMYDAGTPDLTPRAPTKRSEATPQSGATRQSGATPPGGTAPAPGEAHHQPPSPAHPGDAILPPSPPTHLPADSGPPPPPEPGKTFTDVLIDAERDLYWKTQDHDYMANQRIQQIKNNADGLKEDIRRDIDRAQARFHQADLEVEKYQRRKQQGTLVNDELLQMAEEERRESFAELQRQKARTGKVEAWRSTKIKEIRSQRDRAKGGDYHGYRRLRDLDTSYHPAWFK